MNTHTTLRHSPKLGDKIKELAEREGLTKTGLFYKALAKAYPEMKDDLFNDRYNKK